MESISIRVLLADDEAAIRNGLQNAIPWEQYHAKVVAVASNGQEALDLIRSYLPDLVIIDIKMPQIDGLEVIRQTKAAGITCRFLILSGYDDFYLAQKAIRYGANGYFLKPLKIEEFKDELSRQYAEILSNHHSSSAAKNLDELMESSKIFFLNQLFFDWIRCEKVHKKFSFKLIFFLIHFFYIQNSFKYHYRNKVCKQVCIFFYFLILIVFAA